MYTKGVLGMEQCLNAISAIINEWKKDPSIPISVAIVDDGGNLITFARTDGARPMLVRNCIKKAYTAAMTGARTDGARPMLVRNCIKKAYNGCEYQGLRRAPSGGIGLCGGAQGARLERDGDGRPELDGHLGRDMRPESGR